MATVSRLICGICIATAIGIGASIAQAAPARAATCTGGAIAAGVYSGMVVTGDCTVASDVTINGNVLVADGGYLNAAFSGTQLTINGNVSVGTGGKLALGCAPFFNDCGTAPQPTWLGAVTVNGNIVANQALTIVIDSTIVHGNIVANGGGDPSLSDPGLVLPIKDNQVDGNIVVHGWMGAWFGIIRNTVGGNVMASRTVGTRPDEDGNPDSTEIATNVIAGNLICTRNSPPAQIGDSGGSANTVGGNKIGECAGL